MNTSFQEGVRGRVAFFPIGLQKVAQAVCLLAVFSSFSMASNWWDVHTNPGGGAGCGFAQTNGAISFDPANASIIQAANNSTSIQSTYDMHGRTGDQTMYYKWSSSGCGNTGAAYCGESPDSTWVQVLASHHGAGGNDCNVATANPPTSIAAAHGSPWNLAPGGIYYLLVSFSVSNNPEADPTASVGYRYYVRSTTPPTIQLNPQPGTFALSNPPGGAANPQILVTAAAGASGNFVSTGTYNWAGPGPCANLPGQLINTVLQNPYNVNIPFPDVTTCGKGDYTLTLNVTDTGFATATTVAKYTIVDIAPTGLSSSVNSDHEITYNWTAAPTTIDHFNIMMFDPSGNTPGGTVIWRVPYVAGQANYSQKVDFTRTVTGLPTWWQAAAGATYGTNLVSSATVRACYFPEGSGADPNCNVAIGQPTGPDHMYNSTLADPVTPGSAPSVFVDHFNVTWTPGTPGPNLKPPSIGNPVIDSIGTTYTVFYSANNFQTTPQTYPGDNNALTASPPANPNTQYEYYVDAKNGDQVEALPVPVPSQPFWTPPQPPTAPTNPVINQTTLTATLTFPIATPANPSNTQYILMACPGSVTSCTSSVAVSSSAPVLYSGSPSTSLNIPNLAAGTQYAVVACALSLDPNNNSDSTNQLNENSCSAPAGASSPFAQPNGAVEAANNLSDAFTSFTSFVSSVPQGSGNSTPPNCVEISYLEGPNATPGAQVVDLRQLTAPVLNNPYSVPVTGLAPLLANTSFYHLQARFGGSGGPSSVTPCPSTLSSDPAVSAWSNQIDPVAIAFTLPNPASLPVNVTVVQNSITANFIFPVNPSPYTQYQLVAVLSGQPPTSNPIQSGFLPQDTPGNTSGPLTVTGLSSGTPYDLYIRTLSIHDDNRLRPDPTNSFDTYSTPFSTMTSVGAGALGPAPYCPTATSLSATWSLSNTAIANAATLQVNAINASGSSVATSPGISPAITNPTITTPLTISNTTYDLILQDIDTAGITHNYPGSAVIGMTLAVAPSSPTLTDGGTASTGLFVTVTLGADTNSTDSLYAIQIAPTNGGQGGFLGAAGGTAASVLSGSTTPIWKTAADWVSAGNNYNQLTAVPQSTTYSVTILLQQKITPAFIPAGCPSATGILTSGPTTITTPGTVFVQSFGAGTGVSLDDDVFGVQPNSPITAVFNVPISATNLATLITITQGATPVAVNFVVNMSTLTITPTSGTWSPNMSYNVTLNAGVQDNFGFATQSASSTSFLTAPLLDPNSTATSSIVSPLDPTQTAVISLPENAIPQGGFLVPRTVFRAPAAPLTAGAAALGITAMGAVDVLTRAEVDIYRCNPIVDPTCGPATSDQPMNLKLTVPASKVVLLNSIDKSGLGIYTLGAQGNFVLVPGSTFNPADNSVSAPITQSALYFMAGPVATQLDSAYAWPVPYKPALGHTVIHFVKLANDSTIKIYTIMGERVAQLQYPNDGTNEVDWNVTNSDGERVASGVYIYQIKNSFSEKRGKLIIVR